jgi:hypothetical protein
VTQPRYLLSVLVEVWRLMHLPAIVVVAVNVEDLLALDTENSGGISVHVIPVWASVLPREHAFGETWQR